MGSLTCHRYALVRPPTRPQPSKNGVPAKGALVVFSPQAERK